MFKQKYFIDSHKGVTGFFILFLITHHNQFNNHNAITYLIMHGSYGAIWVFKSYMFPDKKWDSECTLLYGGAIWAGLSLYWIAPIIITSNSVTNNIYTINAALFIFISGIIIHFLSDMQKHMHLKLAPETLITTGMFSMCRNINYFGELLIYLSFAILSMHWAPFLALSLFICFIWIPNMLKKDKSLSRYKDFNSYKKTTYLFIPYIF